MIESNHKLRKESLQGTCFSVLGSSTAHNYFWESLSLLDKVLVS